jgi:hypothetical protein
MLKLKIVKKILISTLFLFFSASLSMLGCSEAGTDSNKSLLPLMAGGGGWNGVTQWVRSTTVGADNSVFNSVAVGSDGIYAAGYLHGSSAAYDFGGQSVIINNSNDNVLLVKYDTSGAVQWVNSVITGPGNSRFYSVAVGSDGIYAAGLVSGNASPYDFTNGKGLTINNLVGNVVIVKYDMNGAAQWVKSVAAGPDISYFNSVAVGSDGIYAAGSIQGTGTYNFGSAAAPVNVAGASLGNNIVLVKYDTSGNILWAKSVIAAPANSNFFSVAVGNDGVYAAGFVNPNASPYNFGNGQTVTVDNASNNAVLVKYRTNGVTQWARSVTTGPGNSFFNGVTVRNDGIYTAGYIQGNALPYNFGNEKTVTINNANNNVVLVKYNTSGTAQWARSVTTGPANSVFFDITVGNDGIYAAGYIYGTGGAPYDFGNGKTITVNNAVNNVLVVKYDMSGNAQWIKSVVGQSNSYFNSVAVGGDGVYGAGTIHGTGTEPYDFGDGKTVATENSYDSIVLTKYQ